MELDDVDMSETNLEVLTKAQTNLVAGGHDSAWDQFWYDAGVFIGNLLTTDPLQPIEDACGEACL